MKTTDAILGPVEASLLLGVSLGSVYRWTRAGGLKAKTRHPYLTFDLNDLLAFKAYRATLPPERRGQRPASERLARKLAMLEEIPA